MTNKFEEHASNVALQVSTAELEKRFNQCIEIMTGGRNEIIFGTGEWLNMIQGKKVLAQIINSECFKVKGTDGRQLTGKEKLNAVVKDLLRKDDNILPADFIELKQLINRRLNGI